MRMMGQPKRLGRGIGSGLGKTSGRGHKGQKARTGAVHAALSIVVHVDTCEMARLNISAAQYST